MLGNDGIGFATVQLTLLIWYYGREQPSGSIGADKIWPLCVVSLGTFNVCEICLLRFASISIKWPNRSINRKNRLIYQGSNRFTVFSNEHRIQMMDRFWARFVEYHDIRYTGGEQF
jgi:hypothetical protein